MREKKETSEGAAFRSADAAEAWLRSLAGGSAVTDTEEKGLLESRQPADGVRGQAQQQEEDFWLQRTSAQAEVFIKARFSPQENVCFVFFTNKR